MGEDVISFLDSAEASALLHDLHGGDNYIHPQKLPADVRRLLEHVWHYHHPEELMQNAVGPDGFYQVNSSFAAYYMTLLARRIAEDIGAGLLTEQPHADSVATAARRDACIPISYSNSLPWYRHGPPWDGRDVTRKIVSTGCLASVVLEGMDLDRRHQCRP